MSEIDDVVVLPRNDETDPLVGAKEPTEGEGETPCLGSGDITATLEWFRTTFNRVSTRGGAITLAEWETALQVQVRL